MLRNVIDAYLDGVTERDFDIPLLFLLPSMGFFDVHFIHGPVEMGKDIIAKRQGEGLTIQYSIQSKAGNITQSKWRHEVQGQLHTALWNTLAHPNFDRDCPHQVILATTGELRGNAALEFQEFNRSKSIPLGGRQVALWDKRELTELLLSHGLAGVHQTTVGGIEGFAKFFNLYASALDRTIAMKDIEVYSRFWSSEHVAPERRLLLGAIESEVLAQRCCNAGLVFEGIQYYLAQIRILCELTYLEPELDRTIFWDEVLERLRDVCSTYTLGLCDDWADERNLVKTWFGQIDHASYLVQCSRILEIASLAYFLRKDAQDKATIGMFMKEFSESEPGAARPISDRYAVSIILACLVLLDQGYMEEARALEQYGCAIDIRMGLDLRVSRPPNMKKSPHSSDRHLSFLNQDTGKVVSWQLHWSISRPSSARSNCWMTSSTIFCRLVSFLSTGSRKIR